MTEIFKDRNSFDRKTKDLNREALAIVTGEEVTTKGNLPILRAVLEKCGKFPCFDPNCAKFHTLY